MLSEMAMDLSAVPVMVLEFRDFADAAATDLIDMQAEEQETEILQAERAAADEKAQARQQLADEMQLALEQKEESMREQLAETLKAFASERRKYFESVEQQIVRLSLGIAEKVLQREAATDPLLLSGAVRSALQSVAGRSDAVLKIPASDMNAWQSHLQSESDELTVLADATLDKGDCVLETKVGTADLGLKAQLMEIESSLMAQFGCRPSLGEV